MDQANGVRFHRVTTMPDDGPDQRPPLHELVPFATLKASFIVMNSLVVSGLTLMLLDALLATNSDKLLVALQMLIEINSFVAIFAACRESRPLLLITNWITLFLLAVAWMDIRNAVHMIFPFLYILLSVGLSFTMARVIRSKENAARLESTGSQTDTTEHSGSEVAINFWCGSGESLPASEGPPDYDRCSPPPPYEYAMRNHSI